MKFLKWLEKDPFPLGNFIYKIHTCVHAYQPSALNAHVNKITAENMNVQSMHKKETLSKNITT